MTQMPQLVALFNGVGGGAAALVALLELDGARGLREDIATFDLVATAFTILVGSVSFSGSMVTFAKLQELMTTRPVIFPGLPIAFGGSAIAGVGAGGRPGCQPGGVARHRRSPWSDWCSACCWCCRSAAPTYPIVISLLNAFTGLSVAASGYVLGQHSCCWSAARWSGPPERSSPR